jgi:hypothetical protein
MSGTASRLSNSRNTAIINGVANRRNNQSYHRQVLIEYQRMNQMASEYERKHVYRIECNDCSVVLTDRGMNVKYRNQSSDLTM